jgi:hypothetical protein
MMKEPSVNRMWHEYQIPANFETQKGIIRKLKGWIQSLEKQGLIAGFAFNHYFQIPPVPESPDELRVRFEYSDEKHRETVELQLEQEVKKLLPDYVKKQRIWNSGSTPQHVLQAYEFGSRCAFLAWELIESERFPEEYFSHFLGETDKGIVAKQIPFEFQTHFNHGVMNSLGIMKVPNERLIHFSQMLDSTGSRNKQELIEWLQKNLKGQ